MKNNRSRIIRLFFIIFLSVSIVSVSFIFLTAQAEPIEPVGPNINISNEKYARNNYDNVKKTETMPVIIGFKEKNEFFPQKDLEQTRFEILEEGGDVKGEFRIIPAMTASLSMETIERLRKDPNIAYIEPDYRIETLAEELSWGVDRIDAEHVWNGTEDGLDVTPGKNAGDGIKIAILDTGIDARHVELDDNVAGGVCFSGHFNDCRTSERYWEDKNGHGTLVAGVISSEDNGFGIIGVAPNASLYAVKVIDDVGYGSISDLIQGIEWCMENEIDIISMPIGGFYDSNALHDACDIAYESDILLIAAGGNRLDENPHTHEVYYPAFYDSVIAVGATDKDDVVWHKSNTGIYLELSAPGVEINSTYLKGEYAKASGTSLSCSHVSGVAALALATDPTMSNEQVRKWLKVTSLDLGEKVGDISVEEVTYEVKNRIGGIVSMVEDILQGGETASEQPTQITPPPTSTPKLTPTPPEEGVAIPHPEEEYYEEPGFEAIFAIAGLLAVAYLLRRKK